ncbi:AbrB/MazE/SpoVT family DNA-binding domain-containing protein [Candidatus Saccharibacteria bacterium]|nr:AbrB/MazE/SpoVT family DNA-binding domain-containing protein [Candidatus Saccharibacteria bacterium]
MQTTTISSKYQIVLPAAVRKRLGVGKGDRLVTAQLNDTEVVLRKEQTFRYFLGSVTATAQPANPVSRVHTNRTQWRSPQ